MPETEKRAHRPAIEHSDPHYIIEQSRPGPVARPRTRLRARLRLRLANMVSVWAEGLMLHGAACAGDDISDSVWCDGLIDDMYAQRGIRKVELYVAEH
jgi:hypothetical protein